MADVQVTRDVDDKKLIIEFLSNGSKENVWRAYADKKWFEKWWGPEGWETTVKEFVFKPGGRVRYGMKCVDERQSDWFGQTSWGVMEIEEVEAPHVFTCKDYFSDEEGNINTEMPSLTVTNEFIEEGGKTRIICTNSADSADQIEQFINMGIIEGFSSQLDRLEKLVS